MNCCAEFWGGFFFGWLAATVVLSAIATYMLKKGYLVERSGKEAG